MTQPDRAFANVLSSFVPVGPENRVWVFCDPDRAGLADGFLQSARKLGAPAARVLLESPPAVPRRPAPFDATPVVALLGSLSRTDVVIAAFSSEFVERTGITQVFPALASPPGFAGRSIFLRPEIPDEALPGLLSDPLETVLARARMVLALPGGARLRVSTPAGTNLTCQVGEFSAPPFSVSVGETVAEDADTDSAAPEEPNRHAYLPAAGVSTSVVEGSANGPIVVDVTIGEFTVDGRVLDPFGRVETPVELVFRRGKVVEVNRPGKIGGLLDAPPLALAPERRGRGRRRPTDKARPSPEEGDEPPPEIADRLRSLLSSVPESCRMVVELGFGVNGGRPTGLLRVDECLAGTCRFSLGGSRSGDRTDEASVRLDVLARSPRLEVL